MRRMLVLVALGGCETSDPVAEQGQLEELAKKNEINVDVWDWEFTTGVDSANVGRSVSSAGDVNGDGFDDLVVGAPEWDDAVLEDNEGAAFVFFGGVGGPSLTPDWQYDGDEVGAGVGQSVASAGDVNGDGFDDLVVGETCCTFGSVSGKVHVFHGSATGLAAVPDWTVEHGIDMSFGFEVASAGDINADGFADVVVGAKSELPGPDFVRGTVFVYAGSATGLSADPVAELKLRKDDVVIDGQLCKLKSLGGFDDALGSSVATAGDVDGDGFDDVVVGAYQVVSEAPSPFSFQGVSVVYYGAAGGFRKTPTILIGDEFRMGRSISADFGTSAASAGDVNADGFDDIVVGAPAADLEATLTKDAGAVYLFLGSAAGVSSFPTQSVSNGERSSRFGASVASWGDATGDGFDDVVVGAPGQGVAGIWDLGAVFRFDGSATGLNTKATFLSTGDADGLGGDGPSLGGSVAPAGDVDGDGVPDIIAGAATFSSAPQNATGAAYWLHGD